MTTAEAMTSRLRRRSSHASCPSERGLWEPATAGPGADPRPEAAAAGSLIADPRVEHGVQQVDDEVDEQEHQNQDGHHARGRRALLAVDGLEDQASDAVDVEDALGDDG